MEYHAIQDQIEKLKRVYPVEVSQHLVYLPRLTRESLTEKGNAQDWVTQLEEKMNALDETQTQYYYDIKEDRERNIFCPRVIVTNHGISKEYIFSSDFIESTDYLRFTEFGERVTDLVKEDGQMLRGEKQQHIDNLEDGLEWLQTEALKGQYRQRYKGLGEMNPDQLWETTMDPKQRTMLRVTIEDAIAADQMFTTLMGDHVEPRKNFIVNNALSVSNLDI